MVCAIGTDWVTDKNLGEVLSAQGKEMREIRSNIAALSTQMAALLKCPMAPQWKHPCLSPFLGDGLSDCARYLSIRFLFASIRRL
jgi:hypothetical protein